jgi:hypothetical protein
MRKIDLEAEEGDNSDSGGDSGDGEMPVVTVPVTAMTVKCQW